jgi:amidophosphoribosyltransferase
MGGLFGVISKRECKTELFYGTDYHSHLGTKRAGMAVLNRDGLFARSIHDIQNSYFRIKFESDLHKFDGNSGIGVISDTDAQPILINSRLGRFAIVTVGKINNVEELEEEFLAKGKNFAEISSGKTNQTELVSHLVTEKNSFAEGIKYAQNRIRGSLTMLILTSEGIIAARDKYGRTPLIIGRNEDSMAVASEDCSFPNIGFESEYILGPGETVLLTADGTTQLLAPQKELQICSFLWIYYGYPTSNYEGINVDDVRNRLGSIMGAKDDTPLDVVSSIPDSGTCMAVGYARGKGIPFRAAMVKYNTTWPRSFTPVSQSTRELVAKMKLIPNYSIIKNKRVAFCDDSIVRGTQLKNNVKALYNHGAQEVHIRISCPPIIYPCPYLNFSSSRSSLELITRKFIDEVDKAGPADLHKYSCESCPEHARMVEYIRKKLNMSTLCFNSVKEIVQAIGLPKESLCTHCFDGTGYGQ